MHKFATLDDGSPDGALAAVCGDLSNCRRYNGMTLQAMLDGRNCPSNGRDTPFSRNAALPPLPRAHQFLDASAYVNHVHLVRMARGADMPGSFWTDPLMYQGASDRFLRSCDPIFGKFEWGIDFEAEIAIITDHVPQGTAPEEAGESIRLVMLLNDISLRNLIPAELSKGFGFVQSKPHSACSPVAVAPDGLSGWDGGKLHGILNVDLNGEPFGRADAGIDMTFDFPKLIAHAAKTRSLCAGTIIGSGTVSNRDSKGGPGKPISQGGKGYSCIAEQRMVETISTGSAHTSFLRHGDTVRIWMEDDNGHSIFGDITQKVEALT